MTTKEKVLARLKVATEVLSGEVLAQELQVSRTAIWKAIKELEKKGYQIQHSANGYRYQTSDILDAKEIQEQIQQPLEVTVLESSVSTMKDAQLAVLEGKKSPLLIVADMQEAPHGRFNRPFFAANQQGIYMSLLLEPKEQLQELPQYTILMAVAVAEAIDELLGVDSQIKWVNDIYLDQKKVAGILSEAMTDIETNSLKYIIIGMGINFSIPQEKYPEALQEKATSLFPDGQATITRNQLIVAIWNRFFKLLTEQMGFLDSYRKKSFVLGKKITFKRKDRTYLGTAIAITDTGELIVDLGDEQITLSSGEISLSSIQ
ncbi:biotin--[acetyl-CoA-carboxylase] ligase [Enterococcus dongliensis]|uniref:Bifunctional ligase/repressor BirA n=1 Tax=Enterococcus dongliensis TaxID=2559925 RepID=A0AAW8TLL1_9ENTE|nr:biotin--[acetyl-CoA-carboxylase] ligase [Enterococcus dongliensis]MDT2596714.1 biotin--[acetyl-CoA-carboxylase] ligase [Enterococcus dongliensis]MDT2604555.1 biotin--[acetyl-CoA-carboxylase] ligase [Enterococcus dongliensis]MDT2635589.1 biotin--[acetyl-CoA-carboxylase] ligase [Enterococcus dongliensis]MDT2636616.1 biotin--[acetyl-CoA-carboxylase] ligase [Enterococcus dongliensis]MDT2640930.1 biotin--[acetyl-CoA-carboxylase] ligase [Enterococcus dongliensis]